jgi:hypothetical protein
MGREMTRKELLKKVKAARKALHQKVGGFGKNRKITGLNHFVLIDKAGKTVVKEQQPCFASLSAMKHPVFMADLVGNTARAHAEGSVSDEMAKRYVSWWVRDSFAARVFVTKDEEVILNEGAILDCKYPAALVIIGAIGLRYMREFPEIVVGWDKLRKHVSPDEAIILSHMYKKGNGAFYENRWEYGGTGHKWFQSSWTKDEFNQVLKKELPRLEETPSMTKLNRYAPLSAAFRPLPDDHNPYDEEWYEEEERRQLDNMIEFPKTEEKETTTNSWGEKRITKCYRVKSMKKWAKETLKLNEG